MFTRKNRCALIGLTALLCWAPAGPAAPSAKSRAEPVSTLRVTVVKARDLKNEDGLLGSAVNPYVVLSSGTQKHRTKTVSHAGPEARWKETFIFTGQNSSSVLSLKVFDRDLIRDGLVGAVSVPLRENVRGGGTTERWYTIAKKAKVTGEVQLRIAPGPAR
ncbi:C2 domain-containing protein [Streptomyces sp. NPDC046215]|uniref:C2 domain-containing protein n=1 Tax=Streptomyces stramineus TaxID=173861 RepID=A0ABN1AC83_9ACTN